MTAPAAAAGVRHPLVLDLRDDAAVDHERTGGKAAALARAARGGLTTLPGLVLTTGFSRAVDDGAAVAGHPAVREVFEHLGGDTSALIARSSSVLEDTAHSSMAGQFATVGGIQGLAALETAVRAVLDSRVAAAATGMPMAVLVQPMVEPAFGGVLFGIDPVTGRSDRRVVTAVAGSPEPLVSGAVAGARYALDLRGHVVEVEHGDGPELRPRHLRRLASLADQVEAVFGAPQDVEWAIQRDGELLLLQSRPVTTEVRGVPHGPVYGPGPVAETFPEPLTELEHDLWIPPLREALAAAVQLAGTASSAEVDASDIVVTVRGHVGIDLRLAGELVERRTLWARCNPLPSLRRLRGAWRVGRLRSALPRLAEHLLHRTDTDLRAVPPLAELTDRQLLALLHRSRDVLRAAARPRDPDGPPGRCRDDADDRCLRGAPSAHRSARGRAAGQRDRGAQPGGPRPGAAAASARRRRCPTPTGSSRWAPPPPRATRPASSARHCASGPAGCRSSRAGPRGSWAPASPPREGCPTSSWCAT